MEEKGMRLSLRKPFAVAAFGVVACLLSFFSYGIYAYWDSPPLINFLASWIPFALSLLLAFIPSGKEMKHPFVKYAWRTAVVLIGFSWSFLLWHQQSLTDKSNLASQTAIVTSAVKQADAHSDQKFSEMQNQVTDLGKNFTQTQQSLQSQIGKTESDLMKSIGKVGSPPDAQIAFSLWRDGMRSNDFPIESESVPLSITGIYHIKFLVKNTSLVHAAGIDEWVIICDACSFAGEQKGFDKPEGLDEHWRHRIIGDINPGVSVVQGNEIDMKIGDPFVRKFAITFKGSCNNCGGVMNSKVFWIIIDSSLPPQ